MRKFLEKSLHFLIVLVRLLFIFLDRFITAFMPWHHVNKSLTALQIKSVRNGSYRRVLLVGFCFLVSGAGFNWWFLAVFLGLFWGVKLLDMYMVDPSGKEGKNG